MSLDCGINFEVIWFDQDIVEVFFTCSNAYFAGGAEIYLSRDDLPNLVEALRGFPSDGADTRLCDWHLQPGACGRRRKDEFLLSGEWAEWQWGPAPSVQHRGRVNLNRHSFPFGEP